MLLPCPYCGAHVRDAQHPCPHCGGAPARSTALVRSGLLLGLLTLTATGCPTSQPPYGVADQTLDEDGDGYTEDVDCDDGDATIHPDAEETPGDGVDSNCVNGDDI